jgi:peptidoglycan/LPS O-acetylase OafA/YrhL
MFDEEIIKSPIKKPRLIFLDNIRIFFAILVIFTHVRVSYGGEGSWYYISILNESNPTDTFTIILFYMIAAFGGIFQASLMGLFFLMGAYFTPKSYDKKSISTFWKERLLRLGIPILLYIMVFNPIISYLLAAGGIEPYSSSPNLQGSFIEYYLSKF